MKFERLSAVIVFGTAWLAAHQVSQGVQRETASPDEAEQTPPAGLKGWPNAAAKTLGGRQFWGDETILDGWRIQRHVLTGHYRLLDPDNRRRLWGSLAACRARLDMIRRQQQLQPARGKVVVLLHGLVRSRAAMQPLADYLEQQGDYTVVNVGYPSSRAGIGDHAAALARVVEGLDEAEEINFVGHSMGNLVIRHYLADAAGKNAAGEADPRIGRIVMLAPPNQGSERGAAWGDNRIFQTVTGVAGDQIARRWQELSPRLATPTSEFGVIAGGTGDQRGWNLMIAGDDDGTLSVAETRLVGAHDFTVVPVLHSFIMVDEEVHELTLHFLRHGRFAADGPRRPIEADDDER